MYKILVSFVLTVAINTYIFFPAFAGCDPELDETCCNSDTDCTVWVSPSLCSILPVNVRTADRRAKESAAVSGACIEESVKKLRETAKTYVPICISQTCEFKVPGE